MTPITPDVSTKSAAPAGKSVLHVLWFYLASLVALFLLWALLMSSRSCPMTGSATTPTTPNSVAVAAIAETVPPAPLSTDPNTDPSTAMLVTDNGLLDKQPPPMAPETEMDIRAEAVAPAPVSKATHTANSVRQEPLSARKTPVAAPITAAPVAAKARAAEPSVVASNVTASNIVAPAAPIVAAVVAPIAEPVVAAAPAAPVEEVAAVRPQTEIDRVVANAAKKLTNAYRRALFDSPKLQGRVKIKLKIAASGDVMSAEVVSTELNTPAVEAEMLAIIQDLKFASGEFSPWEGNYKFNFIPSLS